VKVVGTQTRRSVQLLQCGTGPSSDFQAKILGVDTPVFLCNTLFYFTLFQSDVVGIVKGLCSKLSMVVKSVASFSSGAGDPVTIHTRIVFL
jgi:hypothetical protein